MGEAWRPGHLIDDVVECLDLSAIEAVYEAELRGAPPYHPVMRTKLWLSAYAVGVTSSRRLAKLVQRDVGVMMLVSPMYCKTIQADPIEFEEYAKVARAAGPRMEGAAILPGV